MSFRTDALNRMKRNHRLGYTASREEVAVLLAEVERLEQEVTRKQETNRVLVKEQGRLMNAYVKARDELAAISQMNDHDAVYHAANRARATLDETAAVASCWVVFCSEQKSHVHVVTPAGTLEVLITADKPETYRCPNCIGSGKVRDAMRAYPVTCGRCDGQGVIEKIRT